MNHYENKDSINGHYEETIVFAWSGTTAAREDGPQYMTVNFSPTPEMESDYTGEYETMREIDEHEFEKEVRRRQQWVAENLGTLIRYGVVNSVTGHEEIQTVDDLEVALEENKIDAMAFYR